MRNKINGLLCFAFTAILLTGCGKTESDWKAAQQVNSVTAYTDFLGKYPQSVHTDEAKSAIDELDWANARMKNSMELYSTYLASHPKGRHSDEAQKMKDELGMSVIKGKLDVSVMFGGGPAIKTVEYQGTVYQVFEDSATKFVNIQTSGGAVLRTVGGTHRIRGTITATPPPGFANAAIDGSATKFVLAREITLVE